MLWVEVETHIDSGPSENLYSHTNLRCDSGRFHWIQKGLIQSCTPIPTPGKKSSGKTPSLYTMVQGVVGEGVADLIGLRPLGKDKSRAGSPHPSKPRNLTGSLPAAEQSMGHKIFMWVYYLTAGCCCRDIRKKSKNIWVIQKSSCPQNPQALDCLVVLVTITVKYIEHTNLSL